jgi:hypothetical protein
MKKHLSPQEVAFIMSSPPSNGGVFPNAGVWNTHLPLPDGLAPFLSFRTYVPVGIDKFEFCMWVLVAKGASEAYREEVRRGTSFNQGAAGFIEGDDGAVWPGQHSASRGYVTRKSLTYKYWSLTGEHRPDAWIGGGRVHAGFSRDDPQWNWWQRYFDRLEGKI